VVDVGFTVSEPARVEVLKEPGVMATELAFAALQLKVEVPAGRTTEEEALKKEMAGRAPFPVVPLAMVEDAEKFPTLSSATTYQ
jgi:hypothetical protein